MIPDEIKSQIRDAADIVAIIGQHVQLRKAGRNWKGLCPFHGEKTPSFNVTPERGSFICFGCGKKGDVFTFIMEMEGKSFVEAAEQLAERYGIAIPKIEENPELRRARGERAAMLSINKVATAFYRELLADPERGAIGRAYLAKRGVQQPITDKFQLGYAPAEWDALAKHLHAQHVDMELALKLGLVAPRKSDRSYYDRFRDRLVCPIIVPGGDVVGFSARVIEAKKAEDGSEPPKYINSPESSVYKKSKLLFGLAQARDGMQALKRCVLVEGNFDVITLHQAGFTEVVAPLGTALTIEQVGQLKRMTERIVLLYDGDRAGYKATMSALLMCVEAEVEVQVASRPGHARSGGAGPLADGVDPDSLVAGGGTVQLREAIDRAQGGIEFFAFEVWAKARGNTDARARALSEAARLVAKVATQIKRDLIVGTLATALEVDVSVVRAEVARASGQGSQPAHRYPPRPANPNASTPQLSADPLPSDQPVVLAPVPLEELQVIVLFADHPDLIATPEADKVYWLLTDARLQAMYHAARAGQSLHELLSNPVAAHLPPSNIEMVLSKQAEIKDPRRALAGMIANLEGKKHALTQRDLGKDLAAAKRGNDRELQRKLAQLAEAQRKGDRELAARITASLADETNGKKGN